MGWRHQFEPDFPLFFPLTRDGQTIFLTEHTGDCEVGAAVYFRVCDAWACHVAFSALGVRHQRPQQTPWGTVEFLPSDPDGNRLRFASAIAIAIAP